MNVKKVLRIVLGIGLAVLLLIQLVPIDRTHPPTTSEPKWSSAEARALAKEHCFQCHSNETQWPWYSYIAPASWLIRWDVINAREAFNFSEWDKNPGDLQLMVRMIQRGKMPPIQYTLFHPKAVMNDEQKKALIDALTASLQ